MISSKFRSSKASVFHEIGQLESKYGAINLSQGFPNFEGPQELKEIFAQEILNGWNQYSPSSGLPELREALAQFYKKQYQLTYDSDTEITISHGATEALFNSIIGLLDDGDEIIVFEPFYDAYIGSIKVSGAKAIPVRIDPEDFNFDLNYLENCISDKTKAILLNTPHNPIGKVFSVDELKAIAKICILHNLIVISDEVYEHIVFDGLKHQSIAQIEGMRDRTIVISSIAKTYSFTGWKVGWTLAPAQLSQAIRLSHQLTTYCTNQAGQKASVKALSLDDSYYQDLCRDYQQKRDVLVNGLQEIGFIVTKPQGTYFFMADYSELSNMTDYEFAYALIEKVGVATIPPSSFYLNKLNDKIVRFCFAKSNDVLESALDRLAERIDRIR